MHINKNTKFYVSFSKQAGNFGCIFHNIGFQKLRIDAIYKAFSVSNIEKAIESMRCLEICGAGISMPYKKTCIKFIDKIDENAKKIGNINTVVNKNNKLIGYNTDYIAVNSFLRNLNKEKRLDKLFIIGDGSYSETVQFVCKELKIDFIIVARKLKNMEMIEKVKQNTIFNATPIDFIYHKTNQIISNSVKTTSGKILAFHQAKEQFKLYTNKEFPYLYKNIEYIWN